MKKPLLMLLGLVCGVALLSDCSRVTEPKLGAYRAVLSLLGGESPVQMEIAREPSGLVLYLINGAERTRVDDVTIADGVLSAKFPGLENRLRVELKRNSFAGEITMIRKGGIENKLPLRATYGETYRFFATPSTDSADVSGRWEVTFTEDDGKTYPAVAEFSQQGDQVTGTFLTATGDHHVAILFLAHAGHAPRHLLETLAVGGTDLGQEVDVAAKLDAAVQVARQHRLLLRFGHGPFVQVGALAGLEACAVFGFHQRHAELVQVITLARLFRVEDRRAWHVQVGFVEWHLGLRLQVQ